MNLARRYPSRGQPTSVDPGSIRLTVFPRNRIAAARGSSVARGTVTIGLAAAIALATGYGLSVSASYTAAGVAAVLIALLILLPPNRTGLTTYDRFMYAALIAYLVPLLALGKTYATLGSGQIYLPDVLIAIVALLMLPKVKLRRTRPFTLMCVLIALLAIHAVYVGQQKHYLDATKGIVLAFYPLIAVVVAGWLANRPDAEDLLSALPRYVLPWVAVGLACLLAAHASLIAAAAGLALGVTGAFAIVPGMPRRRWLGASCIAGTILLVNFNAKRGPALAIVLAVFAAWLASGRLRSTRVSIVLPALGAVVIALVLATSLGVFTPTQVPVAGHLIARALAADGVGAAAASPSETAAANNVGIRQAIWSYSLHATATEPLLGLGAYHPIQLTYRGNDLASQTGIGTHNSFIGYAFYAGFPAAMLVIGVFVVGLARMWRLRATSIYAPALLGAMTAAIVTALTNVALETTYIGGPSWLVLAAAIGLAGAHSSTAANLQATSSAAPANPLRDNTQTDTAPRPATVDWYHPQTRA